MSGVAVNAPVYLDHNATTRPAPQVVAEMLDVLGGCWGNPSSVHGPGQAARRMLADARARVASFLGCQHTELVFTSGATEANHMAVLGALALLGRTGRRRLVLSSVEHPALVKLAGRLGEGGVMVDTIPVDADGRLDMDTARDLVSADAALVSVMGANNETGVLMPIDELARLCHERGCLLHVDATQLVGKAPLSFAASGADLMSVSAHKFSGPKGIGALMIRKALALPAWQAGRQERGRRGGTENLPGIAGFAAACDLTRATLAADIERMRGLREQLEQGLLQRLPAAHLYGAAAPRLSNTSYLRFGAIDSDPVLDRLERAGVVASSGAACGAGGTQPSHVLLAMGESPLHARAGIRFSLGRDTTGQDIERTLEAASRALEPLLARAAAQVNSQVNQAVSRSTQ